MKETNNILSKKQITPAQAFDKMRQPVFFKPAIQPKLTINQPNDIYEQEADAVAERVMRMPAQNNEQPFFQPKPLAATPVQRKCAACEEEEQLQRKEDEDHSLQLKSAKDFAINRKCTHCEEEEKLQMKETSAAAGGMTAPPIINNVINSLGQSLDKGTRSFMESRFGYDFGNVQIHNDLMAHRSSADINALAYTHGNHVVFGTGQYQPDTNWGKRLLAHELTHVIQQKNNPRSIQRSLEVNKPADKIPNPAPATGLVQTNGETVISYLQSICSESKPSLSGGKIILDPDFCTGSSKDGKGNTVTNINKSKTPSGCSCLCEMSSSVNPFKIEINDSINPATRADDRSKVNTTGSGATVTVPSPNKKNLPPILLRSGNLETSTPPFIILAHELCGHASFMNKGKARDDFFGNASTGRGEHTATVTIENKIRKEQGIAARGTHRDPCCGAEADGLFTAGTCTDFLKTQKAQEQLRNPHSVLGECLKWRDEYNLLNNTSFTLADAVPDKVDEVNPAEYFFKVYFNKDMPLAGAKQGSGFSASVTTDGKENFEAASSILTKRKDIRSIQVEGYASADKPQNGPDYNTRLSSRRIDLVKNELLKKQVDPVLFISFQPTIPGKSCVEISPGSINCSDTESKPKADPKDRKVIIRFTKL